MTHCGSEINKMYSELIIIFIIFRFKKFKYINSLRNIFCKIFVFRKAISTNLILSLDYWENRSEKVFFDICFQRSY